ncbi:threonine dehydratase [Saccharothrix tamanrassetensis]|uniref:Threonine dehydratase n=1 Tax=Saccharothrix tamanrassetensis TaxID=1051531 RepID=A0A841CGX9_9PSEU|nr:serine/threonine dehydratase [Saccharothrix tamanrassetensis]MBB5955387.1 threonine dehydratase [Saccharothrix tamanrassetensis]
MTPDVAAAADRIRPHVRRTPLWRVEVDGRPLAFKLEHLQLTGSFKLRGAVNTLLAAEVPDRVVTASGGNHGLGVATAARLLGTQATVYVPVGAPEGKVRRIEAAGAKLIRAGATYAEAVEAAREAPGFYVEAYNDPYVVAGQGTVGAEVVADAPDVDVIAVAVGGGGLAAGTALAGPHVVAVEPETCCCLNRALAAGAPVDSTVDSVAASALGASRVGELPFELLRAASASSVLVSDAELLSARDRLWEEFRLAVEPAAAVPFAAWLHGRVPGESVCVILCGANTDWTP